MNILKAYADAGATGGQNFGMPAVMPAAKRQGSEQIKNSGDSVRLSAEALAALAGGSLENLSVLANDATYDQYGNVTRQVDALQRDLASLSRAAFASAPALSGQIGALRSRAAGLRAQV